MWDSRPEANTFSVAVYQRIPKASGKGLKKVSAIRVLGYVAAAEAVYDKAGQLCRRLNSEGARVGHLPAWVQKQYSVPMPEGLALNRTVPWLSGPEAKRARQRAARQHLLPCGFVQSHASTYARLVGEVVEVVNFRTSRWGGSLTVDLGLHYAFTPPCVRQQVMPWRTIDLLDCSLAAPLGFFFPPRRDVSIDFGNDPAALEAKCLRSCEQATESLGRYTAVLSEPEQLLPENYRILAPFTVHYPDVFCGSVEIRLGLLDAAKKRLSAPLLPEHEDNLPRYRQLLKQIASMRKGNRQFATYLVE